MNDRAKFSDPHLESLLPEVKFSRRGFIASSVATGFALSAGPLASLGGKQLMVPGYTTLDLGLRQSFKLGKVPMSFRALLWNVTDTATWKVVAANTLLIEERRRFNLTVTADL